jgi:NAD(P)-dependent dehydrogenase (short-subunit alcohol dehydrogenase family)
MKIAITGHTAGIGQALAEAYHGNEIVGLSTREGNNIRNTLKIANLIEPCDMFINNAQAGFAQTELLLEIHGRWINTQKHIVVISTIMAGEPVNTMEGMGEYWLQKTTLELAVQQLRYTTPNGPRITLVRPGSVNDPELWARTLVGLFRMAEYNGLSIPDIALK